MNSSITQIHGHNAWFGVGGCFDSKCGSAPFYMHHHHGLMGTEWSSRTWNYQLKTYTTTSLCLKSPVYDYRATASWKLINQMHGYTVL